MSPNSIRRPAGKPATHRGPGDAARCNRTGGG
jgi:hypothetical protein